MIHYLLNDFSWCNEQSYSGKKGLPSLGIKPETFHFSLSYEAGITRQGETSWQGREFNVQKAFYNPNSFVFNFNKTCLKGKHYQKLHHIKLCLAYYVVLSLEITPFIDYLCAIGTTPSYLKLVIGQGKQHNLIPHLSLFMALTLPGTHLAEDDMICQTFWLRDMTWLSPETWWCVPWPDVTSDSCPSSLVTPAALSAKSEVTRR